MGVTYDQIERRVVERLERYVRQIAAFTDWGSRRITHENVIEFEALVWGFVKTITTSEHVHGSLALASQAFEEAANLEDWARVRDEEDPNDADPRLCERVLQAIVQGYALIAKTSVVDWCEVYSYWAALTELDSWDVGKQCGEQALLYFDASTVKWWSLNKKLGGWLGIHDQLERDVPKAQLDETLKSIAKEHE